MADQKIKTQNLSLPKGGGAIQGIGEKLSVQDFTGSAGFSIPIAASPCRDIAPSLAVSYSSGSGNGVFGIGWNLALPRITRKTTHGIPKYDESDLFLLDDSADLVPVNDGKSTKIINKITYSVTKYYSRNEGSFELIEFYQNPDKVSDCFWKVTDRNHHISIYGKSGTAKIYDSSNPDHIFSWLLEEKYDDKGDHQILIYKRENIDNVDITTSEKNRLVKANCYIEKIIYGHDQSIADSLILSDNSIIKDASKWHFELVFDYGEYNIDGSNNNPYETNKKDWQSRSDSFSTYHSGFEIRTYRKCQNILMFHRFTELGDNPILVNAINFEYKANYASISELVKVVRIGYKYDSIAKKYDIANTPDITFDYSKFNPLDQNNKFQPLTSENGKALTAMGEIPHYHFVDLFSEGVSGLLYSADNGNYYKEPVLTNDNGYNACDKPKSLYSKIISKSSQQTKTQYQQDWQSLSSFPAAQPEKGYNFTLSDVSGDGKLDVMMNNHNINGFWGANSDKTWQNFHLFDKFPVDHDVRGQDWVDMTGSGLSDLVQINNKNLRIYPAIGAKGFGNPINIATIDGFPTNLESSPVKSVRFTNIDGGGRSHLTIITQNKVTYWPNLGYGNFGKEITMENAPDFADDFNAKNLFIADLDGSGTGDLIYMKSSSATIYFNCHGNSFNKSVTLSLPDGVKYDDLSQVNFTDINGRGNSCLVISDLKCNDGPRHYYYDFCQGNKPYLLNKIDNNLGARTEINYGTSVDFYIADKEAGLPWVSNLPFPVHVVTQTAHIDEISNSRYVSQYAYHHGYYDGVEREFRGFGRVDHQDAEYFTDISSDDSQYSAPSLTRTWYHNGFVDSDKLLEKQYAKEYFSGDDQVFDSPENIIDYGEYSDSALSDEDKHLAYVAMAGQIMRSETYGLDDDKKLSQNPYSVSESNCKITLLQPQGDNRYCVFLTHGQENIAYHYERNTDDPQISQSFTLALDEYANVTSSCTISYPRRAVTGALPEQQVLQIICSNSDYFNNSDEDNYQIGVTTESKSYQINNISTPEKRAFVFDEISKIISDPSNNKNAKLLTWHQIYYSDISNNKLELGKAVLPLLVFQEAEAEFSQDSIKNAFKGVMEDDYLTEKLKSGYYQLDETNGYWWNYGLSQEYLSAKNFYFPQQTLDPNGKGPIYEYDKYNLMLTKVTDALNNQMQIEDIDYQTLHPGKIIDINGNISQVSFDPLGRVIYMSHYGTENGVSVGFDPIDKAPFNSINKYPPIKTDTTRLKDILHNPKAYLGTMQSFFYYDYFAWKDHQKPPQVLVISAEDYKASQEKSGIIQQVVSYSDGFGRSQRSKMKVEAGTAFSYDIKTKKVTEVETSDRWLTSGYVIHNNKGDAVKEYEPYYFDSADYIDSEELNSFGHTSIIYHDALGRANKTITAKGFLLKHEWTPWQEKIFDSNDTITDSPYYRDNVTNIDKTSIYYDADFQSNKSAKDNLNYAETYFYGTPTTSIHDNLGHTIIEQHINKSEEILKTNPDGEIISNYHTYDIQGRLLTSSDSRLSQSNIDNFTMTYGLTKEALKIESVDAGTKWILKNTLGNPIFSCDARQVIITTQYDDLHRPSVVTVNKKTSTDKLKDPLELNNQVTERFIYGDTPKAVDNPQSHNLCGQIYQHYDQAGLITLPNYNILEKPLNNQRRFLKDYRNEANWSDITQPTLDKLLQDPSKTYSQTISYDAMGRAVTETDIDGNVTTPKYHQSGRLNKVSVTTKNDKKTTDYVSSISYDAKGQRSQVEFGNNTITKYTYDPKTWAVTNIITTNNSNVELQNIEYLHDPVNNIIQKTDNAQDAVFYANQAVSPISNYTYDAIYQLIEAQGREQIAKNSGSKLATTSSSDLKAVIKNTTPSLTDLKALESYVEKYSYDNAGNITQMQHSSSNSWTKNMLVSEISNRAVIDSINNSDSNKPTPTDIENYFDDCGNQIQTGSINPLSWNYRNNISQAITIKRDNNKNDGEYYIYDSSGHRVRKISEQYTANQKSINFSEVLYLGGIEIRQTLQGDNIETATATEEYHALKISDGTNSIATKNYWLTGYPPTDLKNSTSLYHLSDHLNSTTTEIDENGNIISSEEFSPYGVSTINTGTGSAEQLRHYRYSGKERDATGFYYYGMRYYDTNIARWLSTDPIGPVDGHNIYAFVNGNPVTFVDVGGMARKPPHKSARRSHKKSGGMFMGRPKPHQTTGQATNGIPPNNHKTGTDRVHWKGTRDANSKTSGITPHITKRDGKSWSKQQIERCRKLSKELLKEVTGVGRHKVGAEISHAVAGSNYGPNDALSAHPASAHQNTEWLSIETGVKKLITDGHSPVIKVTHYVNNTGPYKGTLKAARYKIAIGGNTVFDHISSGTRGNIDDKEASTLYNKVAGLSTASSLTLGGSPRKGLSGTPVNGNITISNQRKESIHSPMFTDLKTTTSTMTNLHALAHANAWYS